MLTGLAWALRETQGPAAMPAAPPASFRKSRRVAFDCAGCAMDFPLICDVDGPDIVEPPALRPPGSDPAPAATILPRDRAIVKRRVSASRSGLRAVDEEVARLGSRELHRGRTHRVPHGPRVITVLPVGRVHAAELPEASHEVGLTPEEQAPGDPRHLAEGGPAEVLLVDHGLRPHELFVEAAEGQPRRQDRVLHVEEPIVEGG